jgi:hypothetical protein
VHSLAVGSRLRGIGRMLMPTKKMHIQINWRAETAGEHVIKFKRGLIDDSNAKAVLGCSHIQFPIIKGKC